MVAIGLSLVRFWLLPQATQWRVELENKIGTLMGEKVQIKAMEAEMHGLKPELVIRGLRIENSAHDGPDLEFDRLAVGLDAWDSMVSKQPVIDRIELEGTRLRLSRQADGKISIAGLRPGGGEPLWLFADGEIRLSDIDLEWMGGEGMPNMLIGRAQARLLNGGGKHQLDLRLDLPGKLGKAVKVSAQIQGNPLQDKDWHGKGYLEAKKIREGAFADTMPVRLRSGELGFQMWTEWRKGEFYESLIHLDFERPMFHWKAHANRPEGMFGLDKLAGWLRIQKEGADYRLDAKRLLLVRNNQAWPEADFSLGFSRAEDGSLIALRAAITYLHLEEATALISGLPLFDTETQERLRAFNPKGEIQEAKFVFEAEGRAGFCGKLREFSFSPQPDWPILKQFSGNICGNDRNGKADIETLKGELNLSSLFSRPLVVNNLSGSYRWSRQGANFKFPEPPPPPPPELDPNFVGPLPLQAATPPAPPAPDYQPFPDSNWRVAANQLKIVLPGLNLEGGFSLEIPNDGLDSPSVDTRLQLKDMEVAKIKDYLPLPLMSQTAAKWHSEAYLGGVISAADLSLRGRLADFPYTQTEGFFESHVEFNNVELNFDSAWPHLSGLRGKALFYGPAMFIDTEAGHIGDVPLGNVRTEASTFEGDSWLYISGGMDLNLGAGLKLLQQTPIRQIPQRLNKSWDVYGLGHLDLQLQIPLGAGDTSVNGNLQFNNASMVLRDTALQVKELTGGISFTQNTVEGKLILAKVLEEPVYIDLAQTDADLKLEVGGKARLGELRRVFPSDLWQMADGELNYQLAMTLPNANSGGNDAVRFDVNSDLVGLELKLPAPLQKAAATKKDFFASIYLRRNEQKSIRMNYGRDGSVRLLLSPSGDGYQADSGDVFWGKPVTPATGEPGIGLFIKTGTLDFGAWQRLFTGLGFKGGTFKPRAFDLELDRLLWNGTDYEAITLTGRTEGDDLFGDVDSKFGKGSYVYSTPEYANPSLKLDLESLILPNTPDSTKSTNQTNLDPVALPDLLVRAQHFYRLGLDMGALDLETNRWTNGMNIKRFGLVSDNHNLNLRGSWMRQEGYEESKVQGRLDFKDFGHFLILLGFGREFQFSPGESNFRFSWRGSPLQFSPSIANGELSLKIGRGSILQVDVGLGRALGMLNLQTLRRLLLLDFSDLFGKGLAFDSMDGSFQFADGQARTKGFIIDAAAADILVLGRVGLADRDLDQTISVLPHPVASIPLAGALVGSAAVSAVVDFAHRLVGGENVNMASNNYSVTGSWDNPQIKKIEGNIPLEMINRAWSGIKNISGMEKHNQSEEAESP